MKQYDVIIIGAGPGGIYSAWELAMKKPELKIAVFEKGRELEKRKCPINGDTVKSCVGCPSCAIMSGFGGAGAFSDGKYNITNEFGGTLHEYIGKKKAMELMHTDCTNTIFIGDQMFTDVFGANRTGIPSIMVKKIHWKEEIQIVLKRRLEWVILYFYKKTMKK